MTTYTKNEQRIFNEIAEASMDGTVLDITDFSQDELTTKQIREVISSLVKKNKKIFKTPCGCFWCDVVVAGEGEELYITDSDLGEQA